MKKGQKKKYSTRAASKGEATNDLSLLKKFSNNPVLKISASISSVLALIITIITDNFLLRAGSLIILGSVLIIIFYRHTSLKRQRERIEKEMDSKYQADIDSLLELFMNYIVNYKDAFAEINNGTIISHNHLSSLLLRVSNYIEELLQFILREKVCICIKIIETESAMNENISSWSLRTIARSQSTNAKRSKKDSKTVPVSGNSDFQVILEGTDFKYADSFVVPNLSELVKSWENEGRNYKNTTLRFLNYYKSTMVFPIRIETVFVSSIIKERIVNNYSADYHTIGFLCLDSLKTFEKDPNLFSDAAELLESFANSLYPLLESYVTIQLNTVASEYLE